MEQISPLLDLPSPVSSYHYLYGGESDQYLDAHTSDSQSPINSQVCRSSSPLLCSLSFFPHDLFVLFFCCCCM